jgi:hypothetical protein
MTREITVVLRNRRGIALPFALIGLVAISILDHDGAVDLARASSQSATRTGTQQGLLFDAESALEGVPRGEL